MCYFSHINDNDSWRFLPLCFHCMWQLLVLFLFSFPVDVWSQAVKRQSSGGRKWQSSTPGGQSVQKYDFHFCWKSFSTEKLHDHYISKVIWDKNKIPILIYFDIFHLAATHKKKPNQALKSDLPMHKSI